MKKFKRLTAALLVVMLIAGGGGAALAATWYVEGQGLKYQLITLIGEEFTQIVTEEYDLYELYHVLGPELFYRVINTDIIEFVLSYGIDPFWLELFEEGDYETRFLILSMLAEDALMNMRFTFTREQVAEIFNNILKDYAEFYEDFAAEVGRVLAAAGLSEDDFIDVLYLHATNEALITWGSQSVGRDWMRPIADDIILTMLNASEVEATAMLRNFMVSIRVASALAPHEADEFFTMPVFAYLMMIFGEGYVIDAIFNNPNFLGYLTSGPWPTVRALLTFNVFDHATRPEATANWLFLENLLGLDQQHRDYINNWERVRIFDSPFEGASLAEIFLAPPDLGVRHTFALPMTPETADATHFIIHISETDASLNLFFDNQSDEEALLYINSQFDQFIEVAPHTRFVVQLPSEFLGGGLRVVVMGGEGEFALRKTHLPLGYE